MSESRIHAVTMPKLGLTMEEGTVAEWRAAEGAAVGKGDILLDVEIEKSTNEVESRHAGVLRRQVAAQGDVLPVGALLGVVAEEGVPDDEVEAFVRDFTPVDVA